VTVEKAWSATSATIRYAILIIFAIITVFPFYWMLLTSLRDASNPVLTWPPELWLQEWHWENMITVNEIAPFVTYFKNTIIVVLLDLCSTMVVISLAAFGFAHYNFKGREVIFLAVLATMMIPSESLIITNFRTISRLDWMDTYQALFVPYMAGAFSIYLLREAFMSIPRQLYLAAKVDGCSDFKYFIRILLPVSRPTLITVGLLKVIATWNAFLWPLFVTNSRSMRVISYGLVNFTSEAGSSNFVMMMAGAIYTVTPMLVLYLIARKQIIDGIARGGIKG